MSANDPLMKCRNVENDIKTRVFSFPWDQLKVNLLTAWVVSGIEVA